MSDAQIDVGLEALRLYTTDQVAEMLECSPRHVRTLVASGRLAAVKEGGSVRFKATGIADYIATLPPRHSGSGECGTCGGSPPAGFICSACGRAGSAAS